MTLLLLTAAVLLKTAELSGPWYSALKLSYLSLAVRRTPIFALAICRVHTAISFDSVKNFSADFSKTVKSSSRHFTLRGPLFEALYIFYTWLYSTCLKLIHGTSFRPKLYTNSLSWHTRDSILLKASARLSFQVIFMQENKNEKSFNKLTKSAKMWREKKIKENNMEML
jgi:hypothetical protein